MNDPRIIRNIERFIHEVSTRSCLWNTQCMEYKNKNKRKHAWEEICRVFFTNYNNKSNDRKEHLCRLLQKKWKSLRDTYVRNLRRNRQIQYVHANSLSFLNTSIKFHKPFDPKTENEATDDTSDYNPDHDEEGHTAHHEFDEEEMLFKKSPPPPSSSSTALLPASFTNQTSGSSTSMHLHVQPLSEPKIYSSYVEHISSTTTSSSKPIGHPDDDEDRMFLMSLLSDLKKVPDYNKLEAKSELLLVLNRWKRSNMDVWCPVGMN